MERQITEGIYNNTKIQNSPELPLEVQFLNSKLEECMDKDEYAQTEELLCSIFTRLESDGFHAGFVEGIRFLLRFV